MTLDRAVLQPVRLYLLTLPSLVLVPIVYFKVTHNTPRAGGVPVKCKQGGKNVEIEKLYSVKCLPLAKKACQH